MIAGTVYGLLGLGLSLCYKTTRVVNFAHGSIAMLGAYTAYSLDEHGASILAASVAGILTAAFASAAMELLVLWPLYRRSLISAILATFGVAIVVESIIQMTWGSVAKAPPALLSTRSLDLGVTLSENDLGTFGLAVAISAALIVGLQSTRIGRAMRGVAQDSHVVELLGVPSRRLYLLALALVGATAGVAGLLIGPSIGLAPDSGLGLTVYGFAAAVLGGLGSLHGAVVGGILIGVTHNVAAVYVTGTYADVVQYAAIGLVLLVRVRGLFGDELEAVRGV
ncbi:branched-chain amino acid ABC transporter permease [Nocardioides sp. AN3]